MGAISASGTEASRQTRYAEAENKNLQDFFAGAPDGEYVVIEFATSFERKKAAVETVTPMRDKDGEWRVSGYYIK